MITSKLSPIDKASEEEIELYYEVEETMVKAGKLSITKKQLYEDIDNHQNLYHLKTKDHFHYFTLLFSMATFWLAYKNYQFDQTFSHLTLALIFASIALLCLTWIVTHPYLKYENEARDYFKLNRRLFLYKD